MGTNFYAEWKPNGGVGGPAYITYPEPTVVLHICKSFTSFQGSVFTSWAAWKHFLTEHQWRVVIRDEYGETHDIPDFIASVDRTEIASRRREYDWVAAHGTLDRNWLDADQFSFYNGEFS